MYASYLVFIVRKRKFKSRANVYSLLVGLYSVSIEFSAKIKLDRLPTFAPCYSYTFGQSWLFNSSVPAMHATVRWPDDENTIVRWLNAMLYRDLIGVQSRFHHHAIAFSPSYHRVFTIVPSRFHHRTIAFSPSCHRLLGSCAMVFL